MLVNKVSLPLIFSNSLFRSVCLSVYICLSLSVSVSVSLSVSLFLFLSLSLVFFNLLTFSDDRGNSSVAKSEEKESSYFE